MTILWGSEEGQKTKQVLRLRRRMTIFLRGRMGEGPGLAVIEGRRYGGLFAGVAFGHDGGVEAFAELGGEFVEFVVAVDGDGLAGGVEDYLAVVAGGGVGAHFFEEFGADLAVEVVG
jgi:hypothetical protein